ncbi:hypothetical protein LOZ12_004103 [Ophidiomyces ophidiicola]|uniref:Uncharacterized protein n=1 Tax=Ophidiomyces ophidiicola TaxID=1387563 RepID=A0ACB8UUS2_9EURO|nr:uncharacterized protein LOZ57_003361 [Ophidiomyces ophidiicola]KAI1906402.1 hypothetical protein LOZ64_006289 [Ophidiomyces ophidiicola]KAI1912994.1 hypothetical protein LOZ61_002971 [Ophidiomyces ophidiicola]KAI1920932.1 hypothetical protein LOZ60_006392 [Ophidiomyces ophidiicola]KAI1944355.1 hypothetical protein LOZ62_004227 [Ophidiomyces ophidiicola]KAI1947123.1 hypothetical protein LOZ57_003361 [Ophidiomyces ophidiicola]
MARLEQNQSLFLDSLQLLDKRNGTTPDFLRRQAPVFPSLERKFSWSQSTVPPSPPEEIQSDGEPPVAAQKNPYICQRCGFHNSSNGETFSQPAPTPPSPSPPTRTPPTPPSIPSIPSASIRRKTLPQPALVPLEHPPPAFAPPPLPPPPPQNSYPMRPQLRQSRYYATLPQLLEPPELPQSSPPRGSLYMTSRSMTDLLPTAQSSGVATPFSDRSSQYFPSAQPSPTRTQTMTSDSYYQGPFGRKKLVRRRTDLRTAAVPAPSIKRNPTMLVRGLTNMFKARKDAEQYSAES